MINPYISNNQVSYRSSEHCNIYLCYSMKEILCVVSSTHKENLLYLYSIEKGNDIKHIIFISLCLICKVDKQAK